MCECPGGRPGVPIPNSHYDLCGRKETFEEERGVLKIVVAARVKQRER